MCSSGYLCHGVLAFEITYINALLFAAGWSPMKFILWGSLFPNRVSNGKLVSIVTLR